MTSRNENPKEALSDVFHALEPTPIEQLIDRSDLSDESKRELHESLRVHDYATAREQAVKDAVGDALRVLDDLHNRLEEISTLTIWDSHHPLADALPSIETIRVILRQVRDHDNGHIDPDSTIVYRVMGEVDGENVPLMDRLPTGAKGLEAARAAIDAGGKAHAADRMRIQYAYMTGWKDLD